MEVEIIKAKGAGEDTSTGRKIDRLRVAAYCRVSTDDEDQIKSYNSMVRYYTDLIKSNKQWVFAGVFADKAITGTKTDKREEFQLLIQECLSGNIDLVIAKSIPRFARNTLDTLKYVRMLRERNIAVYFEVEKINTLKDGEFLLTILSSVAQQEVENTSAYVKKGLKMKMKRGELVGFQGCLGYDYDVVTKSLSINEEGAETVRYIFDRYVAGAGSTMIARELNEQGISTIKGNLWTSSSVMGIINNEKYKGDILLGKTFTVDPISKRRLGNLGEEDRFYIKNHHEPIISEEKFARAQEIRERRNGGRKKGVAPGKREKFSRQYAFSCMLECGFCGASLSRRRWHSSSKYKKTIWQCVKSTKHGKRFCPDSKGIPEQVIEDAFIESYRMLCTDHKDVLEEFIKRVEKTLSEDSIEDKIEKLNKNAYNIQYKRKKLLESYLEGVVAKDIYEETDMGYEKKLSEVNAQLGMLEQQYDNEGSLQRRLVDFRKALSKNQILEGFDRGIFESIIEKVIVGGYDENGEKDPYKIIFIYKTGFKNEIGNAKERFGKKSKAVEKAKEMCSHIADEVKDVCSYVSDNTGGTGMQKAKKYVMALDQGTTSSRCILFDRSGKVCSVAQKEFAQYYPQPGWVEHNPMEIWSSQLSVAVEAMGQIGAEADDIAAIGITNQRETTICFSKKTGKPVYPAIVWQCRRTADKIDALKKDGFDKVIRERTGLIPDAYFSATKICWILEHVEGARQMAEDGELLFGTVDTWLMWNLTKGQVFATDYTNASRTMLFDIHKRQWDPEILDYFQIPKSMLPEVLPSSGMFGMTEESVIGGEIPIAGAAGDQQAALFGQCCFDAGEAKNTYGTGCFLLMNTGEKPIESQNGLLTTIAASGKDEVRYALEGSVFVAGAALQWLRDEMRMLKSAPQSEEYASAVEDTQGVYVVPAFTGLGAPYWNPYARGIVTGLTRGTSKEHFIRAVLESLAYQAEEVIEAMEKDSGIELRALRVDGGASANNFLMQFQADMLQKHVLRPECIETTALGAAYLAGLAVGFWKDKDDIRSNWALERTFAPVMEPKDRDRRLKGWKKAVRAALYFANDEEE